MAVGSSALASSSGSTEHKNNFSNNTEGGRGGDRESGEGGREGAERKTDSKTKRDTEDIQTKRETNRPWNRETKRKLEHQTEDREIHDQLFSQKYSLLRNYYNIKQLCPQLNSNTPQSTHSIWSSQWLFSSFLIQFLLTWPKALPNPSINLFLTELPCPNCAPVKYRERRECRDNYCSNHINFHMNTKTSRRVGIHHCINKTWCYVLVWRSLEQQRWFHLPVSPPALPTAFPLKT